MLTLLGKTQRAAESGGGLPVTSGLHLHLDASDTATITASSGAVSQWNDKSTNGFNVSQATAANKPTTGVTTKNGLNVLDFGGNDLLTGNAGTQSDTDMTCVGVFQTNKTNAEELLLRFNSGLLMFFANRVDSYNMYLNTYQASTMNNDTSWHIVAYRASVSNGLDGYIDGGTDQSFDSYSQLDLAGTIFVGAQSATLRQMNGSIGELLVYNKRLSDSEMNSVGGYLDTKWNISWTDI